MKNFVMLIALVWEFSMTILVLSSLVLFFIFNNVRKEIRRKYEGVPKLPNDNDLSCEFKCISTGYGWSVMELTKRNNKTPNKREVRFFSGYVYGEKNSPYTFGLREKYRIKKDPNGRKRFAAIRDL